MLCISLSLLPWTAGSTVRLMANTRPSGQPSRKQSDTSKSNRPGFNTRLVLLPPRTSKLSFIKLEVRQGHETHHVVTVITTRLHVLLLFCFVSLVEYINIYMSLRKYMLKCIIYSSSWTLAAGSVHNKTQCFRKAGVNATFEKSIISILKLGGKLLTQMSQCSLWFKCRPACFNILRS